MFEFKLTNIDKVIDAIGQKGQAITMQISRGMSEGMELFKAHVIKEQMSGRSSPNFGLNVRTGTLRRSWWVRQEGIGESFVVKMGTDVRYAAIHQFGYSGRIKVKRVSSLSKGARFSRPRMMVMPKRLYVLESFYKWGKGTEFMNKAVSKRLSKFIKSRW